MAKALHTTGSEADRGERPGRRDPEAEVRTEARHRRARHLKGGRSVLCQGVPVRYAFVRAHEEVYPVRRLCRMMLESGGVCGYRKITEDLRDLGEQCGKHRVYRPQVSDSIEATTILTQGGSGHHGIEWAIKPSPDSDPLSAISPEDQARDARVCSSHTPLAATNARCGGAGPLRRDWILVRQYVGLCGDPERLADEQVQRMCSGPGVQTSAGPAVNRLSILRLADVAVGDAGQLCTIG